MSKVAAVVLLILFLVSAIARSSQNQQPHQHGSTPAGDGKFNPFVVSDNRGGFYLAFIQRRNGKCNVMLRHSTDGQVFSEPVRVNSSDSDATVRNENPPKVAVSVEGHVYVCWANERGKWKGNIRFARSTDSGKTFSQAISLNSDAEGPPAGHAFQSIALNRSGRIYATWIDERNKKPNDRGAEIWLSTSEDGGRTFARDRRILSDVCECFRTNIQIDSAGRLFLSYRTVPASGPMYRDIIVARSEDAGRTFKTSRVSADGWDVNACPVTGPALCVDSGDRITVLWFTADERAPGLYYTSSIDHGDTYAPRKRLDPDQKLGKHAQAIPQRDGKILVAWDDQLDRPVTFFGVLDTSLGIMRKRVTKSRLSYPTLAANGESAIVAGFDNGNDVRFVLESIK